MLSQVTIVSHHQLAMEDEAPQTHKGGYRQINKALNICAFEDYLEAQLLRLPEIADVEQISPRVIRVLGQNAGQVPSMGLILELDEAAHSIASSPFKAQTPTS